LQALRRRELVRIGVSKVTGAAVFVLIKSPLVGPPSHMCLDRMPAVGFVGVCNQRADQAAARDQPPPIAIHCRRGTTRGG
jgi:hypothetical protein